MFKKIIPVTALLCLFFLHAPAAKADQWIDEHNDPVISKNWSSITSSADGTHLAAAVGDYSSDIYTSTTSGATWTDQTGAGQQYWTSITSSADGTHLAATASGGDIYTSTDSGVTWTDQTASGNHLWTSITSSSNGLYLAATATNNQGDPGDIYTSTDGGVTWTDQTEAGTLYWQSITSSADGTHLAAVDNGSGNTGDIYTSTDSGVTWTDQTAAGSQEWSSITSSSDGTHLAATVNGGDIFTSTDSGVTWTDQTAAGSRAWTSITSSSNGMILAATSDGGVSISTNGGVTWNIYSNLPGVSITSSSNGAGHALVLRGGDIYIGVPPTPPVVITDRFSFNHATSTTAYGEVSTDIDGNSAQGNDTTLTEGFIYGPTTAYGATTTVTSIDNGGNYFGQEIDGLTCGTTYHFKAFASNDLGYGYGADQTFTTNSCTPSPYQWTIQTGTDTTNYWVRIASSADGTKLAVVPQYGDVYTSTTSGATWTDQVGSETDFGMRPWTAISSSADGTYINVAASPYGGPPHIFSSSDSGVTWSEQSVAGSYAWEDIATSPDGSHVAVCSGGGALATSDDYGATWSSQPIEGGVPGSCDDLVYSGDGTKLYAVYNTYGPGAVYVSSDYGQSWNTLPMPSSQYGPYEWTSIASSADGSHLIAIASGGNIHSQYAQNNGGYIYTSSDGGNTWTARTQAGLADWTSVASSADGMDLAATIGTTVNNNPSVNDNGDVYISTDGGATWIDDPAAGTRRWSQIVSSSDGSALAGIVAYWDDSSQAGQIYTAQYLVGSGSSGSIPVLTSSAASSLTDTAATLNGALTSTGGIAPTIEGFVYGLTTSYGATTTTSGSFSTGSFSATVGSLVCNTTYHFASYATNSVGTGYGSDQTFMTSSCPSSGGGGGGSNSSGSSGSSSNTAAVPGYNTVPLAQANYFLKTQQYKQLVELVYQYPQTFEDYVTNGYTIDPQILMIINSLYKPGTYLENSTTHSVPTTYTFTRNLTVGDRGPDVKALQQLLIQLNTGPAAQALALNGPTNYFGKLTQAALAEYQKVNGVVPFVGYFGPKTRAVL